MRQVPMLPFTDGAQSFFMIPFFDLTAFADFNRAKLLHNFQTVCGFFFVNPQCFCTFGDIVKQLPKHGLLVGVARRARSVFGGETGHGDKSAILFCEQAFKIIRRLGKHRVDVGFQQGFVAGVFVHFIDVV